MLVPEPQRNERAVSALRACKVADCAVERPVDAGLKPGGEIGTPRQPRADGMRGEIGTAKLATFLLHIPMLADPAGEVPAWWGAASEGGGGLGAPAGGFGAATHGMTFLSAMVTP